MIFTYLMTYNPLWRIINAISNFFCLKEKCCFDNLWILYLNRKSKLRKHEYFSMYLYLRRWRSPWHLFLTLIPYCPPHKNISIKIWKIHVESGNWHWNLQKTCVKIDTEIYRKPVWKLTLKFTENLLIYYHENSLQIGIFIYSCSFIVVKIYLEEKRCQFPINTSADSMGNQYL